MANCHICDLLPICPFASPVEIVCSSFKPKRKTKADLLRAMTDEELAEYLAERSVAPSCTGKCHKDYEVYGELRTFCHNCWLDWLKQEASDG